MTPASPVSVATLRHHPTRAARERDRRLARRAAMRAWLASRQGAMVLGLGAVALPAFAATTTDWNPLEIASASNEEVVLSPMPFEKAGSSFPGSAFYYLDMSPEPEPGFGEGIHSDADTVHHDGVLDPGPSARSMRLDNSGVDRSRALDCLTAAVRQSSARVRSTPLLSSRIDFAAGPGSSTSVRGPISASEWMPSPKPGSGSGLVSR